MNTTRETQALLRRLAEADRAWQREKARALAWRLMPALLVVALAAVVADAFLQLGTNARLACLGTGFASGFLLMVVCLRIGWLHRNPPERTARFLEARDAELGSKLINALQLAGQADDASLPPLTRSLATQAVGRYDTELAKTDLPRLAITGEARRRRGHAGWALLAFAGLLAAFYQVKKIVLPRFLAPLGDHPPYAFTRVEIVDPGEAGADVIYGGKLTVKVRWNGHEPRELFLSAHPPGKPAEVVTLPMIREGEEGFSQEIADVRTDLVLVAHSRTRSFYSQGRNVRVLLTPKIDRAFLEIAPPAYTEIKAEERPFAFKSASALVGSSLRFRLQSNRPLREGVVEVTADDGRVERVPLVLRGTNEVAGTIVLRDNVRLKFRVTDVDGLPSDDQPEALVSATHDLSPVVRVAEPLQNGYVSRDFKLNARFEASDDYGVSMVRIHRALNGVYSDPKVITYQGAQRHVAEALVFDFVALGVRSGDQLSLFAEAIDNAPEPKLSRSQTVTMTIISEEEYNDFLREATDVRDLSEKYRDLVGNFQELLAEQVKLAEESAAARERIKTPEQAAAAAAEFDTLTAKQGELNQRLKQQAERMQKFVRKDPLYDFEKDLQEQLTREAGEILKETERNNAAVGDLAEASVRPDGKRSLSPETFQQMEREAKEHAKRLGAREQPLADGVEKPLQDLSRLHDVINALSQFERLYQAQQSLAEQARAYEDKGPLNREDQLALKDLAAQQQAVREALEQLPSRLREKAEAGKKEFPKACSSASALADAIEKGRLAASAGAATGRMLEGDGAQGALLARRLEQDMAKLFGHCEGGQGEASDELDDYLKLKLGSGKKQSFEQMRKSRKGEMGNGFPRLGRGDAQGSGSGYSMSSGQQPPVLGNEASPKGDSSAQRVTGQDGQSTGKSEGSSPALQMDKPDVMKGLNPTDRQSDAVPGESSIDEYRALVDEYFKKITRP
ncbi:MAG: hypothetical protein K0R17_918 [Rariglobus sp.]|nr:hypothetical protein [Rariglobus sp.]